jgi:hypothetical protein
MMQEMRTAPRGSLFALQIAGAAHFERAPFSAGPLDSRRGGWKARNAL